MKIKILPLLAGLLVLVPVVTSCLDSDDEIVYSDDATITSCSIYGNIQTTLIEGNDTLSFTVDGGDYPFSIDQISRVITNKKPLPYRTDVRKVCISMKTASDYVTYSLKDKNGQDSICVWSYTDSLDLRNPMTFTVYAPNGINNRLYELRLNVHQTDPDSLYWTKQDDGTYPGTSLTGASQAVNFGGRLYVFADDASQVKVTSSADGLAWTSLVQIEGLNAKADYSSVTVFGNRLLLLAGGQVYTSADAITWQSVNQPASALVAASSDKLLAISEGKFMEAVWLDNTLQWTPTDEVAPEGFPQSGFASASLPMPTNSAIEQLVLVGSETTDKNWATVWTGYSTDMTRWFPYEFELKEFSCPKLENMALISYSKCNTLYVFGGKGVCNTEQLSAFQRFYVSTNYGLIWKPVTQKMDFPAELKGLEQSFAYTVDEADNLWIMPAGGSAVWKGHIESMARQ